uniref:TonB-dependent receptor n=2 Tax=unclassified Prevotella TaxID=2638335 RepID=A0AB33IZ21_9BACT
MKNKKNYGLFMGLLFTTAVWMPNSLHAQNIRFKSDRMTLKEAFVEIEKQAKQSVDYDVAAIDLNRVVNAKDANGNLHKALASILKGTGYTYEMSNGHIIISKGKIQQSPSNAQQRQITGTVKDAKGEPLTGATVVQKGTTNGTVTDVDGRFVLNAPVGSTLLISYIGSNDQEVKATDNLSIVLTDNVSALEEIVVVGYGTQKKMDLTGSVANIGSKDLANRPVTTLSSAIQGLAPGVAVTQGQGRPGQEGATIRVRGTGTLNSASPYILIDGVETGTMNSLDPNDIESISVLKDAASAAIYGSKAANGVILITTKRGAVGKPSVNYSGSVGWQSETGHIERMNSADAATYYNLALSNGGKAPKFSEEEIKKFRDGSDPYNYPNTDWHSLAFDGSGFMQHHNISVSGGNEFVKYMTSGGFLTQEGVLRNCNRMQFNVRSNIDIKLSDHFTAHSNLSYINNSYDDADNSYVGDGSDQILRQLNRIAPWIPYKNEDGTYGTIGDGNPIAWLDLDQAIQRKNQNFTGILSVDYKIIDGLVLTAQGTYISNVQDYKAFTKDIQYNKNKYHGPNKLTDASYLWNRYAFDALLNYHKTFGQHDVKGLLGYRLEDYNYKELKGTRTDFPNNEVTDMDAGTESTQTNKGYSRELAMMSYFGRINYEYANRYLFEANLRADASSRFARGHRWGYFPSFSAGWRISEESFMESTRSWLDNLKIRASWGQLGNQDALSDYYPALLTYSVGRNYPFNGVVNTGIAQTSYKLSTISWEKTTTWGVGLDMTLLRGLTLTVDYYNRKTTGIIMSVPVPGTFGLSAYKDNVGSMQNSGIEVSLGYQKQAKQWSMNIVGNVAFNKNEILDLGGVNEMIDDYYINRVGCAYRSFFAYQTDGLFQSKEEADAFTEKYGNPFGRKFKAGDIRYVDVNEDGKLTSADRTVFKAEQPKMTFGLSLSGTYKNFDLSMLLQGAIGVNRYFNEEVVGDFTGDTSSPSTVWFDAWSADNPNGKFPYIAEAKMSPSYPTNRSSFWIFNTNYLRCKSLQIGYTLPNKWLKKIGLDRIRLYYAAENLFKLDNLPVNIDPEAPSGRGSHYPQLMTNSFGINIKF